MTEHRLRTEDIRNGLLCWSAMYSGVVEIRPRPVKVNTKNLHRVRPVRSDATATEWKVVSISISEAG
jgi:hypothetical protein